MTSAESSGPPLPWSLQVNPELDQWVSFPSEGRVVVRSGKAELGQGIQTALAAIAADELAVHPARVVVEGAATGSSPNEFITAGSGSIEQSGMALRQACAQARAIIVERVAEYLGSDPSELVVDDGEVVAPDGRRVSYWAVTVGRPFAHRIEHPVEPIAPEARRWAGTGLRRVDLERKIRGDPAFVHDLVVADGMHHGRVIRPPRAGSRLSGPVPEAVAGSRVIRNGSFVAILAATEWEAVRDSEELAAMITWEGGDDVGIGQDEVDHLLAHASQRLSIVDGAAIDDEPGPPPDHAGEIRLRATYSKPFHLHASIGPSAAVARFDGGRLEVWSHSQGVEILRLTLAEVLRLDPDDVAVTHVEGAGCYGHNGADDVALDAALVAVAEPGVAVSVKWSRGDEHRWEPAAPAMAVTLEASVDGGAIKSWQHDVYSYAHMGRPTPSGDAAISGLLASWDLDSASRPPPRGPSRGFHGGGHRNADPLYEVGERQIVKHFLADAPVRTSSTRGLGAFANVFAIESFIDELAAVAGHDPVAFRLSHLADGRARDVIDSVIDLAGGLVAGGGLDAPGRGLAFAQYENHKAYCAVIAEATVDARSGEVRVPRAWIAADAGEVIDPDGLVNQLEGGFVQAMSWTLKEQLGVGPEGVTTDDWESYPILRFSETPMLETRILARPADPPLGAGEASVGPTAAAIANAIHDATGVRIRDLPLRPARVRAALSALM